MESEGGEVEELVDEENGVLISTLLRQYFLSLRTIGQWRHTSDHWNGVVRKVKADITSQAIEDRKRKRSDSGDQSRPQELGGGAWGAFLHKRLGLHYEPHDENDESSYENWEHDIVHGNGHGRNDKDLSRTKGEEEDEKMDLEILLMRKFWGKWVRKTGKIGKACDPLKEGEYSVDWTRVIAPMLEGRMINLAEET